MKSYLLTVVTFQPALECHECPTLTNTVVLNPEFGAQFTPICPVHALVYYPGDKLEHPTSADLDQQFTLISRYVLSLHNNSGRVLLISKVSDLATIPGYEATTAQDLGMDEDAFKRRHLPDVGWIARYEAPGGERSDVAIVWSWDFWQFFAYQDGQQITE